MKSGTPLGRARGTGAAGGATHHWAQQQLASLAALALSVWLMVSFARLPMHDHGAIAEWLSSPLAAVPMILFVVSVFWHIALGLRVLVEDYVDNPAFKALALVAILFYSIAGGVFAIFSILAVAFTGGGA